MVLAIDLKMPANQPKGQPKVIVIIPAYNEEKFIASTLKDLKAIQRQGIIHEIVVVDDGSRDKTAQVAKQAGVPVVRLRGILGRRKNFGKAYAFFKGAQFAREHGADILVTLDADLKDIKPLQIKKLVESVKHPHVRMTIGTVSRDESRYSGQRAIKMKALEPLFRHNKKWEQYFGLQNQRPTRRTGYGLERALNSLLGESPVGGIPNLPWAFNVDTEFDTRRTIQHLDTQRIQIDAIRKQESTRQDTAKLLRQKRLYARKTIPTGTKLQQRLKQIRKQHLRSRLK